MAPHRAGSMIAISAFVSRVLVLGCVLSLPLLLAGCPLTDYDWELYVRNESEQEYLIRTEIGGRQAGKYAVDRILAGADGVSVSWYGDAEATIELLDQECRQIGTFQSSDGNLYTVPGVEGIKAWVNPSGRNIERWNTDEIELSAACGGYVPPYNVDVPPTSDN